MGKSKWGLAFVVGAAAGYVASLFISDDTRKAHRKEVKDKADQLKKLLEDPQEQERVKAIFEKNTTEAVATYRKAKGDLAMKLSLLKGSLEEIDKDKYLATVGELMEEFKSEGKISEKHLAQLKKQLTQDFGLLQKNLSAQKS